jgi:hypothetical protein
MGEIPDDGTDAATDSAVRRMARAAEAVHTLAYYTPEIRSFTDDGFKGWWHAYFAYRSAPMGPVPASVVTAVFYNFAPRMVERAVPGCWDIMSPTAVRERQLELVEQAVTRCLATHPDPGLLGRAAELLRATASSLPVGARPLYAAWAGEPWPGTDLMDLWHGCTLLREFRFDGHNIALAAAPLDPVECHLMMASHGYGNAPTIQKIRGWTADEWDAAHRRLVDRGWLTPEGGQTTDGGQARRDVERTTDRLAAPAAEALGDEAGELADILQGLRSYLMETGAVHGVWPPPTVLQ